MVKERDRMGVSEIVRSFIVALLLSPGLAAATGSDTAVPGEQPIPVQGAPAMKPDTVPSTAMWLPMMPVARPQVYFWAPPPGTMWPVLPQYPARMAMPPVVWVMVPVPAASLTPAQADYGPVSNAPVVGLPLVDAVPAQIMMENGGIPTPTGVDYGPVSATPVVELPLFDSAIAQTMLEDAALAAAVTQAGNGEVSPVVVPSGVEQPASASMNSQSPAAGAVEPSTLTVETPANVMSVDYGTVAPTPVVDLLVLQTQDAGSGAPESTRAVPKPVRKSGTPPSSKPMPTAKSAPAKRMCWSKGVVAPCR